MAPDVALAESVNELPDPIDAIVVPVGMPVPVIVSPAATSSIEDTDPTDALPLAVVPVKVIGVVPLMVTVTF